MTACVTLHIELVAARHFKLVHQVCFSSACSLPVAPMDFFLTQLKLVSFNLHSTTVHRKIMYHNVTKRGWLIEIEIS